MSVLTVIGQICRILFVVFHRVQFRSVYTAKHTWCPESKNMIQCGIWLIVVARVEGIKGSAWSWFYQLFGLAVFFFFFCVSYLSETENLR